MGEVYWVKIIFVLNHSLDSASSRERDKRQLYRSAHFYSKIHLLHGRGLLISNDMIQFMTVES